MPDIVTIQDALSAVMDDVRAVAKNDVNKSQGFPFRGVDAVVNATAPALRRRGVVVLPVVESIDYVPFTSSKGTAMMCCRVVVRYVFVGPGGDRLEAIVPGEAMDSGDKSTAKAMSVAFRTALLQSLALPTDEPDPDTFSYDRADGNPPAVGSASSEGTTAKANDAAGGVASVDVESGQAAPYAAPSENAAGDADASAAPEGAGEPVTIAYGEGATDTDPAPSPKYLSKDDQALLKAEYGGQVAAIKAYKARFGEHITRLADITYEMRDKMIEAGAA